VERIRPIIVAVVVGIFAVSLPAYLVVGGDPANVLTIHNDTDAPVVVVDACLPRARPRTVPPEESVTMGALAIRETERAYRVSEPGGTVLGCLTARFGPPERGRFGRPWSQRITIAVSSLDPCP
jgi:hypothetical protein